MNDGKNPYAGLYIYHVEGSPDETRFEPDPAFLGRWVEGEYAFLFFSRPSRDSVAAEAQRSGKFRPIDHYEMTYEQWQGGEEIQPIRSGTLIITPFWLEVEQNEGDRIIRIDPGVVFGAGAHPTTRDCLSALNRLYVGPQKPRTVLDIGTGTGILALAAAALGAEKVLAVDLNPLCVSTTRKNISRNGLQSVVRAVIEDALETVMNEADLMIANIHMEVVERLIAADGFSGKHRVILSGLMRSQANKVEYLLSKKGARIVQKWSSSGTWTTFLIENE